MQYVLKTAIIPPPADSLILQIKCPNSYYSPPKIVELDNMPPQVASLMWHLWNRSIHIGRDVNIYQFKNVYVTCEGLVFDQSSRLIDCTQTLHSHQEVDFSAEKVRATARQDKPSDIPKAVLAKSRGADNYGHFVIEMLTRAWFARTYLNLTDWPALIHKSPSAVQNASAQALQLAGYKSNQILISGHDPIHVKELIFVDGLASHTQYISPYVMQCLDAIASDIQPGSASKIYVPRRPAQTRDFVNESESAAMLSDKGFLEAVTASMDFRDQIALFKGASTVVGPMGAALTNLAFCKPGTDVFLFMPSSASEVLFWMISQARRLNYWEIRTKEVGPQTGNLPWDRALDVSPNEIIRIVGGNPKLRGI